MSKKYKVLWERPNDDINEDNSEYLDDIEDMLYEEDNSPQISLFQGQATPFGMMMTQDTIDKRFKFWICHTNFRLGDGETTCTKEIENVIAGIDGVEYLAILTPYRFKIAIAKMFEDQDIDVRNSIHKALTLYLETQYGNKKI